MTRMTRCEPRDKERREREREREMQEKEIQRDKGAVS